MPLAAVHWEANARLIQGSENRPPMRPGERNPDAVRILQKVLMATGFTINGGATGVYTNPTAGAVREVETQFRLEIDQGIAGRQVFSTLDRFLTSPGAFVPGAMSGATLAVNDALLAVAKVVRAQRALDALNGIFLGRDVATDPVTEAALRTHFRLVVAPPATTRTRVMTFMDLAIIQTNFRGIRDVLSSPTANFVDAMPENGPDTPAEAPFGGPIRFGPVFRNFDWRGETRFGDHSRVAMLIHEATHVVDGASGIGGVHISEFEPEYDTQPADLSIHNPSSYAGFAAHVFEGSDPNPRYGAGDGRTR